MKWVVVFSLAFLLVGCGPRSLEDYRAKGNSVTRTLIQEMERIHTREELIAASPRLKKQFDSLAQVMIAAQKFCKKHPDIPPLTEEDQQLSERLRGEMNRLFALEGGREVLEQCQQNAMKTVAQSALFSFQDAHDR